jgi:hypothetical protein
MGMAARRITSLLTTFNEHLNGKSIQDYFDIRKLTFTLTREDPLLFSFQCKQCESYDLSQLELPTDVQNYIHSYLFKDICVEYTITYGPDYPFKPPVWTLKNENASYLKITHIHNSDNIHDWSPAITIEKDMLAMIVKLTGLLT